MRTKTMTGICVALIAMAIGAPSVWAARKKAVPETPLTEAGQKLEARCAEHLKALQTEISKALPTVDEQKKSAYSKAREAEKAAEAHKNDCQTALNKNRGHVGLLNHRKAWIGRATKGVAEAKENLKQTEAMTGDKEAKAKAVKEAQEALAKIQENYDSAASELKKSQDAVDKAKLEEPQLIKELEAAQEALAQAQARTLKAIHALNLESSLSSDKMDAQLAKYVVLFEATPRGLAEFAQQGKEQVQLVERLLADAHLMKQMIIADGASNGKYGQAMKIYTDIRKASTKASGGVLQRLALAISLEHAVPVAQRNATGLTNAPATVDPVNRYLHFEKAFLSGELDAGFKGLSVWDLRMVVNGNEPDETLAWGREMLRNYRPDHISTSDYRWRYVAAVRTDIKYGSQDNKYDKPELQFFQNILMNGGVCGRRAFFGRFILRAFGIPTTARPQRGHAALAHWTPDGWVVCLGAGWGHGWVMGRKKDLDFLAITQARNSEKAYLQVKRAQWIGDVMGEKRTFGFLSGDPAFWNGVALYRQRAIIQEAQAVALAAVGEELGEANESKVKYAIEAATVTGADRKIGVGQAGVITIPAAACSKPTKSTGKIIFMRSTLGGMQLHYSRNGKPEAFEYTFDAPAAGKYALTARVVTPSWKQSLLLTVNGTETPTDIALPFTVGMWDKTQPVMVSLVKGRNVLRFSRNEPVKGLTIKDFTLRPVK
jgi:murein DD-endopeptidase MepM/ murein hydrolase activator NlpD